MAEYALVQKAKASDSFAEVELAVGNDKRWDSISRDMFGLPESPRNRFEAGTSD